MIRLICIEDHSLIVEGLQRRFRPSRDGIQIVQSFINVDEAINRADPDAFDLIMLDLWLPGSQPVENVKKLINSFPGKPIVVLTMEDTSFWKKQMQDAGVSAYLTKNADKAVIKRTLLRVSGGEVIPPFYEIDVPAEAVEVFQKPGDYYLKPT